MSDIKTRIRKNFVFPIEIIRWAEQYAKTNNTTLTRIVIDHFIYLRQQVESGHVNQI